MTTIKKVAQHANVSTATVSHVINETRFVSEETRTRVLKAMEELNYIPNPAAQSLRSQKTKTIGLLIPILEDETNNIFFMRVARGIEHVIRESGYHIMLANTNESLDYEKEQIKYFKSRQVDGLIIAPTAGNHEFIGNLVDEDCPVVFIDRKPEGIKGDFVLNNGFQGCYDAVKMLIDKGHRKIGILSGLLNLSPAQERLEGYRQALTDHGIPLDENLILIGESSFESGYEMTRKLYEQFEITALFVASNAIAMGSIGYIQDKGIKVPEELAIIGFDNYDWGALSNPPLSVINQSAYELGAKAAEVLLKKLNKPSNRFKEYRLPTQLVIRNSF
ncbi:LacI family DNA-binding transcriptional regulator [Neobacillus cucumis]|uniref:LacI family DNA-binding transcriptional regulator n=1 Tax=Neobacillus cucumis TaxID=1740721 RepID=UPI0028531844|nr:LacI family DNA-binding transcriptional regulator [Neobacillus cucumis]MDR4949703.1 LacI family DNA-binding transcriptional regulator [Neobacillus cucumis]